MAIDRTGISSLDAGASNITYEGNEGPKSPQEKRIAIAKSKGYSDEEIMEYEDYRRGMEEGKPGYPILEIDEYFKSPFAQLKVDLWLKVQFKPYIHSKEKTIISWWWYCRT